MTETALAPASRPAAEIAEAYRRLKEENAAIRAKDAAREVGVSEGELVASRTGDGVIRLKGKAGDIIKALTPLGEVMALTRNEHVVHEKVGVYDKISVGAGHGLVLNVEIDLRLFLNHWKHAFAVTEETRSGTRHSLQFFDSAGLALHKIYLREGSDHAAYATLVERFQDTDQAPGMSVEPAREDPVIRPDSEIDRKGFHAGWAGLKDTHEFVGLLRDFDLDRHQAVRLIGSDFADAVTPRSATDLLNAAAESGAPIMCFVGNHACIQIHTGPVSRIEPRGPWINVLDDGFNLHLRQDEVGSAYVVRKPTTDGIVTSLELYDRDDKLMAQFFGARKPGEAEREDWRALAAGLERLG